MAARAAAARLRDEVADGLRVASFGADSFRRTVRIARRPRCSTRAAAAARTRSASARRSCSTSPAPLTVFEDGLGLFEGLDTFIGEFTRFEQSRGLPTGAR